ncbi:IS66 family transposase [Achromobacter xylosoxidans]|uniref:IS66 family transposase n=1 Tax=Alcaligenes xylosoxydans xylosoxydans TaxID=85698 RepID=UPI003BF54C32
MQAQVDALREELLTSGVLHADKTPIDVLDPDNKKMHSAYHWAFRRSNYASMQGVVNDFIPSRVAERARASGPRAGQARLRQLLGLEGRKRLANPSVIALRVLRAYVST